MSEQLPKDQAEAAREAELAAQELKAASEQLSAAADQASEASEKVGSLVDPLSALVDASSVSDIVYLLAIFALACFVGYYVVWSVTPALHTPLMSVTNAVSSVVIVGALIAVGAEVIDGAAGFWSRLFGFVGVILASVNIFGGFLVTQRMLAMYKKKER